MSRKLPQTDSIEKLAKFWQKNDLADFEDELEEISGPVFARRAEVRVPLDPDEIQAVETLARSRGVATATLLHDWVAEKLAGFLQGPHALETAKSKP